MLLTNLRRLLDHMFSNIYDKKEELSYIHVSYRQRQIFILNIRLIKKPYK